jgi:hypothetical protein
MAQGPAAEAVAEHWWKAPKVAAESQAWAEVEANQAVQPQDVAVSASGARAVSCRPLFYILKPS